MIADDYVLFGTNLKSTEKADKTAAVLNNSCGVDGRLICGQLLPTGEVNRKRIVLL